MATALAVGMVGAEPAQARSGDPIAQFINDLNRLVGGKQVTRVQGKSNGPRRTRAAYDDDDDDDDDGRARTRSRANDNDNDDDDDDDDGKGRGDTRDRNDNDDDD
ncbi:MAG: hypothetical protein ACK4L4_02790 [Gemmobacter sp.]